MPSWRIETDSSTGETKKNPIYNEKNNIEKEKRKHAMEIELILRYSPFAKEEDLLGNILNSLGSCFLKEPTRDSIITRNSDKISSNGFFHRVPDQTSNKEIFFRFSQSTGPPVNVVPNR